MEYSSKNISSRPLKSDTKGQISKGSLDIEKSKVENGFIGRIFGGQENVSLNVASIIIIIFSISIVFFTFKWSGNGDLSFKDSLTSFTSTLSLILGYIFGRTPRR